MSHECTRVHITGFVSIILAISFAGQTCRAAPAAARAADDAFPIMCWEPLPAAANFADTKHGLASLAECGFTVAGFVQPEQLPECERLGLRAIVDRPDKQA